MAEAVNKYLPNTFIVNGGCTLHKWCSGKYKPRKDSLGWLALMYFMRDIHKIRLDNSWLQPCEEQSRDLFSERHEENEGSNDKSTVVFTDKEDAVMLSYLSDIADSLRQIAENLKKWN